MGLSRPALRTRIKDVLIERILDGFYGPGDRLIETQIARELGTSQGPVREALRELEVLRFVVSEPYKGTRVREVSAREVIEIYPVRAALEEVAARAAATNLGGRVEALEGEFEAMLRAADSGDLDEQVLHDVRFHRAIVEASGNRTLLDVWTSLRIEARTLITFLKADIDLYDLAKSHGPVLEALARGRPAQAGRAVRRHVESFGELIRIGEERGEE